MSTLIELNALRVANKMNPLKAWKESKAKLIAAIAKLSGITPTEQAFKASVEVTKVPTGMTAEKKAKAEAKAAKPVKQMPVKKVKATGKVAREKKVVDGITLATIAAELDMNPKVARAKLRRALDGTAEEGRWVFTEKKAQEIKALLKGDNRKKD